MRRAARQGVVAAFLSIGLLASLSCRQGSEPSESSPPSASSSPKEGFGQRLGRDVTGQPGRTAEQPRDKQRKIVVFGDSLTAGLGVAPEESFPAQLQRRLDDAGYAYRVVNAGVSGDTTAGGVRRVEWVLNSRPDIVILELGANDGLRGIDPDQTRSNLEQIITRLKEAGTTVVIAGMQLPPNYGAAYTGRFQALYPELARLHGLTLIPFFLEGVATKTDLNQADGIHPTGPGYRIIVEHVMPVLEPLLRREKVNRL